MACLLQNTASRGDIVHRVPTRAYEGGGGVHTIGAARGGEDPVAALRSSFGGGESSTNVSVCDNDNA